MRLLLDTCTFLWIASGDPALSDAARRTFQDPANEVFLSSVSAWEIAVKLALGKLTLPVPPRRFVPAERERHGIRRLGLEEDAAVLSAELPLHHRDPFDRMLICQAVAGGLTLLTPDPAFSRYTVPLLW